MEGLPGFRSLSTAACLPPARPLHHPSISYPRLTSSLPSAGTVVQATWTHSSPQSGLLASAPAALEVKSNPCSRLCQIQRNITSPSLAQNACWPHAFPAPPHRCLSATWVFLSSHQAHQAHPSPEYQPGCPLAQQAPPLLPAASLYSHLSWKVKTILDSPTSHQTLLTLSERSLRSLS